MRYFGFTEGLDELAIIISMDLRQYNTAFK